jgi:hypothetical protein
MTTWPGVLELACCYSDRRETRAAHGSAVRGEDDCSQSIPASWWTTTDKSGVAGPTDGRRHGVDRDVPK